MLLGFLLVGFGQMVHAQKEPTNIPDQPLPRFPMYQIKVDLVGLAVDNLGMELEVLLTRQWSVSMVYGTRESNDDLRQIRQSNCLVSRQNGLALGARHVLSPGSFAAGWSVRGTLFINWREDQAWACPSTPSAPLFVGREYGLSTSLHYLHFLGRTPFFLEGFAGLGGLRRNHYEIYPGLAPANGWDWQLPVGLMLGLRL